MPKFAYNCAKCNSLICDGEYCVVRSGNHFYHLKCEASLPYLDFRFKNILQMNPQSSVETELAALKYELFVLNKKVSDLEKLLENKL